MGASSRKHQFESTGNNSYSSCLGLGSPDHLFALFPESAPNGFLGRTFEQGDFATQSRSNPPCPPTLLVALLGKFRISPRSQNNRLRGAALTSQGPVAFFTRGHRVKPWMPKGNPSASLLAYSDILRSSRHKRSDLINPNVRPISSIS